MSSSSNVSERVLAGDIRAASRLMRMVDDADPNATRILRELLPHSGKCDVIGITGSPGAGKSTLTDRLIAQYRAAKKRVGVIAVDPTSPFTGGAILGDRIRMQDHATDEGVFIRSLATRGNLGGLSRATGDCIRIFDAMGFDVVIVETVGVGQDEIDIAGLAHTTIVVLVPGMGDDIQAIKAGILEVADIFAVNKADLDGADRTVRELRAMLELRHAVHSGTVQAMEHDFMHRFSHVPAKSKPTPSNENQSSMEAWEPPILKVISAKNSGIKELVDAIGDHHAFLKKTGQRQVRDRTRAAVQFVSLLRERLVKEALAKLEREQGQLDEIAARIAEHRADPYELADKLSQTLSA